MPGGLAVGQHLIPQLPRAEQAAGCLQPPPLVDLLQLSTLLCGTDHPDAAGVGHLRVEPRVTPVDRQPLRHGRRAVAEPAVDAGFAGLQSADRICRRNASVQLGEQTPQHPAPSVRGGDRHPCHAGHRQHRAAGHRQPQIQKGRHSHDVPAVTGDDGTISRHHGPPHLVRLVRPPDTETRCAEQRHRRPVRLLGAADGHCGCVRCECHSSTVAHGHARSHVIL